MDRIRVNLTQVRQMRSRINFFEVCENAIDWSFERRKGAKAL